MNNNGEFIQRVFRRNLVMRLSVCLSQAGIETTGRIELIFGVDASFYTSNTVL